MWTEEFERYKAFPEFKQLRDADTFDLAEFKRIYYWEWGHRMLGRVIGLTYGLPWLYFVARGKIRGKMLFQTGGLLLLGGMQGAIGWWMVKSGLEQDLENPRVNEKRLATHLGSALTIYSGLMWLGLNVSTAGKSLKGTVPRWGLWSAVGAVAAVGTTALSGALVAGRDAGLIYNRTLIIPKEERVHDYDAQVQWNHRVIASTTALSLIGLSLVAKKRFVLPSRTNHFLNGLIGMTIVQTTLGVSTLWWLVKTEVAALHQFGSVLLLTATLHYAHDIVRLVRRIH